MVLCQYVMSCELKGFDDGKSPYHKPTINFNYIAIIFILNVKYITYITNECFLFSMDSLMDLQLASSVEQFCTKSTHKTGITFMPSFVVVERTCGHHFFSTNLTKCIKNINFQFLIRPNDCMYFACKSSYGATFRFIMLC